jgi:hypothetical protein
MRMASTRIAMATVTALMRAIERISLADMVGSELRLERRGKG